MAERSLTGDETLQESHRFWISEKFQMDPSYQDNNTAGDTPRGLWFQQGLWRRKMAHFNNKLILFFFFRKSQMK